MPAQLLGKDEGAVEIVQLEKEQEDKPDGIGPPVGQQPEHQHRDEDRHFHQEPAPVIVERNAPLRVVELPVARIHKEETHIDDKRNGCHDDQKEIKLMKRHVEKLQGHKDTKKN